jgi:opacity protein-like surface antigen
VYYYRPKYRRRSEWGLNLHLEGAAFGHASGVSSGGSMWGGGIGLRYRPVPLFALETDLDFVGGRDYNDYQRTETATTINGLFFLNPRSRAQVYLLAGFGWSWAHVVNDVGGIGPGFGQTFDYDYFGGQGGVGLEFRVSKHFALNFDARAFIRTRIDDNTSTPEFNSNGQTTNTSAGALFTGGMTFYF